MDKLKNRLIDHFVFIYPAYKTYFIVVDKPSVKLNKEIILLNYKNRSPFKDPDVLFYSYKNKLFIWFTPDKLALKKIYIPETFLLFKKFNENKDSILLVKNKDFIIFLVIKNKLLAGQLIIKNNKDINRTIELLKREYSLTSPSLIDVNGSDSLDIKLQDIIKFSLINFDVHPDTILRDVIEYTKTPIITFLIMLNIFDLSSHIYVNHALKKEKIILSSIKERNLNIKKKISYLENQSEFWDKFKKSELNYPNIYNVLTVIGNCLLKHDGHINTLNYQGNTIIIWVVSSSSSMLVEDLMKTGYFANIKILRISRPRKEKGKEIAQLEIRIKSIYGR